MRPLGMLPMADLGCALYLYKPVLRQTAYGLCVLYGGDTLHALV